MARQRQAEQKFFKFYDDYAQNYLRFMTGDQVKTLIMSLVEYHEDGIIPDFENDNILNMAFSVISGNIDRDKEKYLEMCERNRQNRAARNRAIKDKLGDDYIDGMTDEYYD